MVATKSNQTLMNKKQSRRLIRLREKRKIVAKKLAHGELEDEMVTVEVEEQAAFNV